MPKIDLSHVFATDQVNLVFLLFS